MIRHRVKSKRDVILQGKIYRPDADGYVDLPEEVNTGDCAPVQEAPNSANAKGANPGTTQGAPIGEADADSAEDAVGTASESPDNSGASESAGKAPESPDAASTQGTAQ